jgi:hypothetical protein
VAKDDAGKRRARKRRKRHERALAHASGAGTGLVVGGFIGGPPGAAAGLVIGAALGPELEPLVAWTGKKISAGVRRRQAQVLAETGISAEKLREKIDASEQTQLLTGFALNAAARTTLEGKLRTLGRSLASGLLADDNATIVTEQLIIAAIADIEGPQLAMLELLVRWAPGHLAGGPPIEGPLDVPDYSHNRSSDGSWQVRERKWSSRLIAFARPNLASIAPSLLGTLQKHGLVVQNDNAIEAIENYAKEFESQLGRQYNQQTRAGAFRTSGVPHVNNVERLVPPLTWSPTELGEQVFLRFLDAGTKLDDVWTSGPADQH